MYKTTAIFLFLFLLSCTVTKRVHRPGFHIEWKKNYKIQKDEVSEIDISATSAGSARRPLDVQSGEDDRASKGVEGLHDENTSNLNVEALEARESNRDISPTSVGSARRPLDVQLKSNPKKSLNLKQHAHLFFVEKTRKYAPLKMPKAKKDAVSDSGGGVDEGFLLLGYILLGIGGFLLMGALLSYFGFWLIEDLFYSLVFSGNGIVAGIVGFILFLLILIFVFIAYGIVHYLMGGAYMGFIVSSVFIGAGLLCLLIWACI